ncbi:MAG: arginine--tRNA ligase [bacterium]
MTGYLLPRSRRLLAELLGRHGIAVAPGEIRDAEGDIAADLALPLFKTAKERGRNPGELAAELASELDLTGTDFVSASPLKGYLNFRFDPARFAAAVCSDFGRAPLAYGTSDIGSGRTVVIDYSSPNIAKPFSVGHLRSTVIGQALKSILQCLGYRVIGDNHLGDWGTQFGKLLCAFERWGSEADLKTNPTGHLLSLYVRFHEEAKTDPELEPAARAHFRKLETGDRSARARWEEFVAFSRAEFGRIYELLGVKFDQQLGESFYSDRLEGIVHRALASGVARHERPPAPIGGDEAVSADETVIAIPLDSAGIDVPLILQKSDGTSLYATREIATAEHRIETWHPEKILYVVGNEQQLYFKQFNAGMKLLGHDVPCVHVNFGLIRLPGGRMSTREGRVILLEDVIREAVSRAEAVVAERDLSAEDKEHIARIVGIGAIKYADLSQTRIKEVVFDWDKMLALEGDSAPYLQYAYTRTHSILRKASAPLDPSISRSLDPSLASLLTTPEELSLLRTIARYPETIAGAAESYEPHRIASRVYRLARDFSAFYDKVPVLRSETPDLLRARLYLVEMTGSVIRHGLGLLGIETVERM